MSPLCHILPNYIYTLAPFLFSTVLSDHHADLRCWSSCFGIWLYLPREGESHLQFSVCFWLQIILDIRLRFCEYQCFFLCPDKRRPGANNERRFHEVWWSECWERNYRRPAVSGCFLTVYKYISNSFSFILSYSATTSALLSFPPTCLHSFPFSLVTENRLLSLQPSYHRVKQCMCISSNDLLFEVPLHINARTKVCFYI